MNESPREANRLIVNEDAGLRWRNIPLGARQMMWLHASRLLHLGFSGMSASSEALKIEPVQHGARGARPMAWPSKSKPKLTLVKSVVVDRSRDALLTEFGKTTLQDRYLLAGESYQDMFARVATAYADDGDHAQRVYDYMSRLWFMPATPVLSNGGADRGLPISCFLNAVDDSLEAIVGAWNENVWLAANGGGIGTYWGGVRSIGETVKGAGQTSGIIPFIRVMDSLTLAISQGSLRRGSAAVYLDVHHPEIEEFLEIRKALRRLQQEVPEPAPRPVHHRRVHGGRARRREIRPALAQDGRAGEGGLRPGTVAEDPRDQAADRRALPDLLRHREPRHAAAPARARPVGEAVQPVQRDHAAHGQGSPGRRPHRRVLPVIRERRDVP